MAYEVDARKDEHPHPYFNLFPRLAQHLPAYTFDSSTLFHSSYDNWHVLGHGDTHIVARISQNELRIEREFKQAQMIANDPDYLAHFVRPIQITHMPAQRPGEVNLIVSVIEAPSLNYIREISKYSITAASTLTLQPSSRCHRPVSFENCRRWTPSSILLLVAVLVSRFYTTNTTRYMARSV